MVYQPSVDTMINNLPSLMEPFIAVVGYLKRSP